MRIPIIIYFLFIPCILLCQKPDRQVRLVYEIRIDSIYKKLATLVTTYYQGIKDNRWHLKDSAIILEVKKRSKDRNAINNLRKTIKDDRGISLYDIQEDIWKTQNELKIKYMNGKRLSSDEFRKALIILNPLKPNILDSFINANKFAWQLQF